MMKYTTTIFLLFVFAFQSQAANPILVAGDEESVIHMQAGTILRWNANGKTMLDMRGGAAVFQGDFSIRAPRFLVWFSESAEGERKAIIDVYAGNEISFPRGFEADTESIPRMTSAAGLVIDSGNLVSAERPIEDDFMIQAAIAHGDLPPEAAALAAEEVFGVIRPSAERFVVSDLTDDGATVTLTGSAQVAADDVIVTADAIRIRIKFKNGPAGEAAIQSLFAMGAVDLKSELTHITADSLYVDWPMQEGIILKARIRTIESPQFPPVQFFADVLRQQSLYRFRIDGRGYFTTSMFWFPHYRIESKEIQVVAGQTTAQRPEVNLDPAEDTRRFYQKSPSKEKDPPTSVVVSARHNVVYLESAPIFYWPYVAKDVTSGAFLLVAAEFGSSSTMGRFLRLRWDLYDLGLYQNNWSDLNLRTDFYSERGFGTGLDFAYRGADRVGFLRGYYINDTAEEDDRGIPLPKNKRSELTFRHREFLSNDWIADLELGHLSDRRFLKTYDRQAYDNDKDRETMAQLSRFDANTLLQFQARARLNNFQTQVERQGVAYHIIGERLWDSPLIWTSHTDAAHLRLRLDKALDVPNPDDVSRFDTAHEISWPFQLGALKIDPYLWGDGTVFSEDAEGDSAARGAAAYGVRAATNFYRTFNLECPLLQIEGLRHTVTPAVTYENVFAVTDEPEDFILHDEIDDRDELHRIRLGLRNRLETHRKINGRRQTVELALLDVEYVSHFKEPDSRLPIDEYLDADSPNKRISIDDYIELSALWNVTDQVSISSLDNRYNVEEDRAEALNGELTLGFWQPFTISYVQKYYLDLFAEGQPSHSVSMVRFAYQPLYSRWRIEFATAYDFDAKSEEGGRSSPEKLGTSLFLTRQMDGWDFTFGSEFNQGRANETVLSFYVSPPGINRRFSRRGPI